MNLSELPAVLEKNKAAAAGVGAVAVVGFALYAKRKGAGSSTNAGAALSAGSQTAAASGGAAYDSSTSDLYNALEPQLEAIGNQLDQMQGPKTIPAPAPPAPAPAPAPAPVLHGDKGPIPSKIPVTRPRPTPPPSVLPPKTITYRVKPGDNLTKIAKLYPSKAITSSTIYSANKATIGSNPNLIKPGQTLVIR